MNSFFTQASNIRADDGSAASFGSFHGWKLEDAKTRFSKAVRLARDSEAQPITVSV